MIWVDNMMTWLAVGALGDDAQILLGQEQNEDLAPIDATEPSPVSAPLNDDRS